MKKYLVRVQSSGGYGDDVYIVKARNFVELETFMNYFLEDTLDGIGGYEYNTIQYISRRWQQKHNMPSYDLCGTWIGSGYIRQWLERKREEYKEKQHDKTRNI